VQTTAAKSIGEIIADNFCKYREQACWQGVGAMKSGVSRINTCMVSRAHMGRSVALSANVTSGPVTALINVRKTELFYRRYFKVDNSTVKGYFLTKFCGSFRDTMQCA